jgi:hypothetical protein
MSEAWYANNNVGNKLKQTLEGAIVGQGLHILFKGLEEQGRADIIVVYNGETISFLNNTPTLNTSIIEPLVVTEAEDTMQYEQEQIPAKPKRTRKKAEATESEDT